jgi:hypothetical protein
VLQRVQRLAVVAVGVGDGDALGRQRGVALLGPQGAQQRVRQHEGVLPLQLGGDDHPAGVLVPVRVVDGVARVVLRLRVDRHAQVLAPAHQFLVVVRAARLGRVRIGMPPFFTTTAWKSYGLSTSRTWWRRTMSWSCGPAKYAQGEDRL